MNEDILAKWKDEAMNGKDLTYDRAVRKLCMDIAELCIAKHRDYGTGNLIGTSWGHEITIGVRLSEKIERLAHLVKSGNTPQNESKFDSLMDIIGYTIAWLMIEEGTFELPMAQAGDGELQ